MNRAPPINLNANKPVENASKTVFLIGFLVIIILVGAALLYAFRDKIFKKGKVLANNVDYQKQQGFGTYGPASIGSCLTASNSCEDTGNQTITQKCIPNPITGLGCIDDNGNQTFNDKITRQNCNPICRKSILLQNDTFTSQDPLFFGTCDYLPPYDTANNATHPCLPNTKIEGYSTTVYTCYPNDSLGINECSYKCSDIGQKAPGQNLPYEEDENTFYYIPACTTSANNTVNPKTKTFTLNSFPWEIAFNLPANGIVISKGFTIKNHYNPDGTVNLNIFDIDPKYKTPDSDPTEGPKSTITINQLQALDNNLYTYGQCDVPNPKSLCSKYYYYNPTDIESGLTKGFPRGTTYVPPQPSIEPILSSAGINRGTKNCFTYPYYNNDGLFRNNVSVPNYPNSLYKPEGIGSFGYAIESQICSATLPTLEPNPDPLNPGTFFIPQNDGTVCFPYTSIEPSPATLSALTKAQCLAADSSDILSIVTTANSNGTFNLQNLPGSFTSDHSGYPPNSNNVYNTCKTVYPEITSLVNNPGILSTCQYLPDNDVIDFSDYVGTPSEVTDLIGVLCQFNLTSGTTQHFMTLQSTPCDCTSTNLVDCTNSSEILQTPFGFCNSSNNGPYAGSIPLLAVYNGMPGGSTGYWNRPGCDPEFISVVTSVELLISPRGPVGDGSGDILCDIYAYFNASYYGYLTYNYGNNGTIDCAFLTFQPLQNNTSQPQYTCINKNCNPSNTFAKFRFGYDSGTSSYYILAVNPTAGSNPAPSDYNFMIGLPGYDGTYLPNSSLNISWGLFDNNINTYTFKLNINVPNSNITSFEKFVYIKQSGLYAGQDIGSLVTVQKSNPCVKNTCNLFYTETPEFCSNNS